MSARLHDRYRTYLPALRAAGAAPGSFDVGAAIGLARHYLGRSVHTLVAGHLAANPASRLIADLSDPWAIPNGRSLVSSQWTRNEAHLVTGTDPDGTQRALDFPRRSGYVVQCRASIRTGLAWDPKGNSLLLESYGTLTQAMTWGRSLGETSRRPKATVSELTFIVPSGGFFHLLIETIPALLAARCALSETIELVHEPGAPKFVCQWVDFLAKVLPNVIHRHRSGVYDFEALVIPGIVGSGTFSSQDADLMRSLIGHEGLDAPDEFGPSLYLSRLGERRSPSNEAEIERVAAEHGFQIVRNLGRLSPVAQVRMASRATKVVGPHGAALALSVFMPTGSALTELSDPTREMDVFGRMARAAGIRYQRASSTLAASTADCWAG